MGTVPRTLWRSAVRSVLLALLTALAWLAWGAGTASAASLLPDPGDLPQPEAFLPVEPLPAPPVVVSVGETAVAAATSLADPATATVNTLEAPAVPVVAGTVETVAGLVPGLPLVQEPLPLPLPDILPLPDQLPPLLPEPLPLPLPDLLPVPVAPPLPGLPPLTTPAPGPVPAAPSLPASDPAAQVSAAPGLTPPGLASLGLAPASPTPTPAEGAARSAALRFGFMAAQDLAGLASHAEATAAPAGPGNGPDHPGRLDPPSVANGAATVNSGSAGGSAGPADLGGSWPALPAPAQGPDPSGTQALPAGPSFDPGSSPD